MDQKISVQGGSSLGFCGLLTILFIGLKLTHYIDWSWVWVLSPLWLPASFVAAILSLALIFFVLISKI